jgi:predicted SAM-dependent methyltransferase
MGNRIHVGCGTVYLDGYINVDVRSEKTFLASQRPDLVEAYKTTDSNYYGRHQDKTIDKLRKGPLDQELVCDEYGTFFDLPGSSWTADEILARHVFEHMSLTEAHRALDECDKKLQAGGVLRLDVPDHEETLRLYKQTGDEFYVRHLLGPRKNDYGYHCMSYTKELLKKVVESHGFILEAEEPNIHFYPAFCLRFKKPGGREPREYALKGITFDPSWNVLDIGPGPYPLEQANHYVDVDPARLEPLSSRGKSVILADVQNPLPFPYKYFDFVFCSHVLEHLEFPEKALQNISMIAKRGVIVVPSAFKEFLFLWEEDDHKWWIFPPLKPGGPIRFMEKTKGYADAMANKDASKALCRLFRSGPNSLQEDQRILRKWYFENEDKLDVVVYWENDVCLQYL